MKKTEILVIGAGLAGCIASLIAADAGLSVTIITSKTSPNDLNTGRAQGGIIYKGKKDSSKILAQDIFIAGCKFGYMPAIKQLAELGPKLIDDIFLKKLNIPFDRKNDKDFDLTSEGAHSVPRIIHSKDETGKIIYEYVFNYVKNHKNIMVLENTIAIDLLTSGHSSVNTDYLYQPQICAGVHAYNKTLKKVITILAKETILATGGLSGLFLHSTNPDFSRGDGIAMAKRAGVRLLNMEYIQFHPTGLYHPTKNRFLLSESLRGEGAVLLDNNGKEFMHEYHPQGNLAPRDVTARAIYDQMIKYKTHFVFLDISHRDKEWIQKRFPHITSVCKEYGYDITKAPVPVVPVAHYSCGGIMTDLNGKTSMKNLRAVGEVACTGVHGANRLASTSLLECLVWGYTTSKDIIKNKSNFSEYIDVHPWKYEHEPQDLSLIYQDWQTLRNTMWNYVGPVRSPKRLERANTILSNLRLEVENFYDKADLSDELIGLRNGIDAALTVLHEAMRNTKSLGCHYYNTSS